MMEFIARESSRFVGRAQIIEDVVGFIDSDVDVPLVISGAGGVGKTALAAKLDAVLNRGVAVDEDAASIAVGEPPSSDELAVDDVDHRRAHLSRDSSASSSLCNNHGSTEDCEDVERRNISSSALSMSLSSSPTSPSSSLTSESSLSSLPSPCPSPSARDSSPTSRLASLTSSSSLSSSSSQRCLTLINGLVSSPLNSFDDFLRRVLVFLEIPFDDRVARVCGNLATLTREALSNDYESSRVVLLDGIRFLRGEASAATKLSWLPLKLGE